MFDRHEQPKAHAENGCASSNKQHTPDQARLNTLHTSECNPKALNACLLSNLIHGICWPHGTAQRARTLGYPRHARQQQGPGTRHPGVAAQSKQGPAQTAAGPEPSASPGDHPRTLVAASSALPAPASGRAGQRSPASCSVRCQEPWNGQSSKRAPTPRCRAHQSCRLYPLHAGLHRARTRRPPQPCAQQIHIFGAPAVSLRTGGRPA